MFKMYEHYSGSGFHLDITSIYYLLTSVLLKGHMPAFCEVNIHRASKTPLECAQSSFYSKYKLLNALKLKEKIHFMARQ